MLNFDDVGKPKLHFISHLFPTNVADCNFNPLQHFPEFQAEYQCCRHRWDDIEYSIISPTDWVIIGGGDLYNVTAEAKVDRLLLWTGGRVISWGCGYNIKKHEPELRLQKKMFALYTTRDYDYRSAFGDPERYVPCPSCMYGGLSFSGERPNARRIGVIEHKNHPVSVLGECCKINNSIAIDQILEFIRTSEIIATNSFHICYWSVLLNKPVLLLDSGFYEKYKHLKYPVVRYSGDLDADIAKMTTYPEALDECRKLNREFFRDILTVLRADNRKPGVMLSVFIEIFEKLKGRKVAVKGAGLHTKMLLKLMTGYFKPICICEKDPAAHDVYFEYPIVDEAGLKDYGIDAIVVSSYRWRGDIRNDLSGWSRHYEIFDIYEELEKKGIRLPNDFYEHECCEFFWKNGSR
jgi:hypothetical protein